MDRRRAPVLAASLAVSACRTTTYHDAFLGDFHSRANYERAIAWKARSQQIEDETNASLAKIGGRCQLGVSLCMVHMSDWMRFRMTPLELQQLGRAIGAVIDEKRGVSPDDARPLAHVQIRYYYAGYPYFEVR